MFQHLLVFTMVIAMTAVADGDDDVGVMLAVVTGFAYPPVIFKIDVNHRAATIFSQEVFARHAMSSWTPAQIVCAFVAVGCDWCV